jgi:hypothetical protein
MCYTRRHAHTYTHRTANNKIVSDVNVLWSMGRRPAAAAAAGHALPGNLMLNLISISMYMQCV